MTKQTRRMRFAAAILFSLIMACLLAFGGLLAGWYLWDHFGPPAKDPDDTEAYFFGLLVGGVMALVGGMALLWKFWPRPTVASDEAEPWDWSKPMSGKPTYQDLTIFTSGRFRRSNTRA
jgi:hypothetical protein